MAITGTVGARVGGSDPRRAAVRVVLGGAIGLAVTCGIGHLFHTVVG